MITHIQQPTITVASGTGSATIDAGTNICHQLLVEATTSTTTFDIKLTDVWGHIVYEKQDITGKVNDIDLGLPSHGNWTLTIENASVDEAFTTLIHFRER